MADSNVLDFWSTYMLQAALTLVEPEHLFFRDRYFPTGAGDIFSADKVLVEVQKGTRKMAPLVGDRLDPIPVERTGYEIHEIKPARIAVMRTITIDDLLKRGFGEALYSKLTPAQRQAKLQQEDLKELDKRISRREEWMSVQTMINNACIMQEYVDAKTVGNKKYVQYYEGSSSEHKYTVAAKWNSANANIIGDVAAMCQLLARRGLNAEDLIIGADVADVFYTNDTIRKMLDKNFAVNFGAIDEKIKYPGVSMLGTFNFRGFVLTVWVVSNSYDNDSSQNEYYFPQDGAMVTFPECGHMMYGRIDQMPYGSTQWQSLAAKRVAKFTSDNINEVNAVRLQTRPLAAPKTDCPYIYAPQVVS